MRCASFAGLNGGDFEKRSVPKPARIPPQTPPAGGKSAEAGRNHSPRQIVSPRLVRISSFNHLDFSRNSFELCPTNTANEENRLRGINTCYQARQKACGGCEKARTAGPHALPLKTARHFSCASALHRLSANIRQSGRFHSRPR